MANVSKKIPPNKREAVAMEEIRKALQGLEFGSVTIVVQDGVVVQVDRTSKTRIDYSAIDQVSGGEGI